VNGRHAILYDADCGFCRWALNKVLAWDRPGRLRPVAIQSDEGQKLLAGVDPARRLDSWHLVSPDGDVRSGGAALGPLGRMLPGGAPLYLLAERFPGAADRAYRWIADHRTELARVLRTRCPELRRA
jgi:predicted DCC family thiol-disulfide oxidoreductase YuxK